METETSSAEVVPAKDMEIEVFKVDAAPVGTSISPEPASEPLTDVEEERTETKRYGRVVANGWTCVPGNQRSAYRKIFGYWMYELRWVKKNTWGCRIYRLDDDLMAGPDSLLSAAYAGRDIEDAMHNVEDERWLSKMRTIPTSKHEEYNTLMQAAADARAEEIRKRKEAREKPLKDAAKLSSELAAQPLLPLKDPPTPKAEFTPPDNTSETRLTNLEAKVDRLLAIFEKTVVVPKE